MIEEAPVFGDCSGTRSAMSSQRRLMLEYQGTYIPTYEQSQAKPFIEAAVGWSTEAFLIPLINSQANHRWGGIESDYGWLCRFFHRA